MRSSSFAPAVLVALATVSAASSASAACKRVEIDSKVTIAGKVRPGVVIKVGTDWDFVERALGIEPDGAVALTTDADGRIEGGFDYCDGGSPPLLFYYRTDFNEGSYEVEPAKGNFDFRATIPLGPADPDDFRPPHPPTKIKFRFPVRDRKLINHHDHLVADTAGDLIAYLMSGPLGLDHRPLPQEGKRACLDYAGHGGTLEGSIGAPYCYGKHKGTDYMLIGGFDQMDNATNYVVAAADGVITKVADGYYDRCHLTLGAHDNDAGVDVTCDGHNGDASDGGSFDANEIVVDHGFDTNAKPYAVTSRYLHIKRGSARVKKGEFVRCGQVLAEIGSSGNSSAPHLHFEVKHEGSIVDPYKGKYSSQRYWTDQSDGPLELPGVECQDPKDRYGDIEYDADLLVVGAPTDLGILDKPPSGDWTLGKARFWKVVVKVKRGSVVGLSSDHAQVRWTLPSHAVIDESVTGRRTRGQAPSIRTKLLEPVTFYVPIANARVPALDDYSFDVRAEITQEKFGIAKLDRFVHISIPQPQLRLVRKSDARKVVDSVPACGAKQPVYQVAYGARTSLVAGKPGDPKGKPTPPTITTTVESRGKPVPSDPISVCYGDTAKVTITAVDPQGVEKATRVKTLSSPRFVADAKIAPVRAAGATTVVIPPTHAGEKPFKTLVFKQLSITTDPRDVGDESLPRATPKGPVQIAWTDLQYLDHETKTMTPFVVGKSGAVRAHYETRTFKNDTLVLELADTSWPTVFTGKLTVTDGWKRTFTQEIRGANGELPPPAIPDGLERLLVESGFQLGGDPQPLERLPQSSLASAGVSELSILVRELTTAYAARDVAAIGALRGRLRTFAATSARTKRDAPQGTPDLGH